jgi:hypothetical protein
MADDFNLEVLGQLPMNQQVAGPILLTAGLIAMLSRMDRYNSQFRDTTVVFEPHEDMPEESVLQRVHIVRQAMGRVIDIVAIAKTRPEILRNMVWVIPDTRDVPAQPSQNPVEAGVQFLQSMVVFIVRPFKLGDDMLYHASLITSKLSSARAAIPIPQQMLVTYDQLIQGCVAMSVFRNLFTGVAWPANAVFFDITTSGLPIAPAVAEASTVVHTSTTMNGTAAALDVEADLRVQRDARVKAATKDADKLTRFRGTCDPLVFNELCGALMPTMGKAGRGIREAMRTALMGFQPSDALVEKLIGGKFGSSGGVTENGYASVTDFIKGPVKTLGDFVTMAARVVACFRQAMGNVAADYTNLLFTSLQHDMVPQGSATAPRLGISGALDVANDALYRVANNVLIEHLTGAERWAPVMLNVKTSERYADALVGQNLANIKDMMQGGSTGADDGEAKRKRQQPRGQQQGQQQQQQQQQQGGRGPKGGRSKKPRPTPAPQLAGDSSTPTDSDSSADEPSRRLCYHQAKPEGCKWGLKCNFDHDAQHPKTDATKRGRDHPGGG